MQLLWWSRVSGKPDFKHFILQLYQPSLWHLFFQCITLVKLYKEKWQFFGCLILENKLMEEKLFVQRVLEESAPQRSDDVTSVFYPQNTEEMSIQGSSQVRQLKTTFFRVSFEPNQLLWNATTGEELRKWQEECSGGRKQIIPWGGSTKLDCLRQITKSHFKRFCHFFKWHRC